MRTATATMTKVMPGMRITLRMKIIARRRRSSYHSLPYHAKDYKVKKLLNP